MSRDWIMDLYLDDEQFKKYKNRKVNLGNPIAIERGALYIVVLASKLQGPFLIDIAKCNYYLSVFFYKLFAYILSTWITIIIVQTL